MRVAMVQAVKPLCCLLLGLADMALEVMYPGPASEKSELGTRHVLRGGWGMLLAVGVVFGLGVVISCAASVVLVPAFSWAGTRLVAITLAVVAYTAVAALLCRAGLRAASTLKRAHARGLDIWEGRRLPCWAASRRP